MKLLLVIYDADFDEEVMQVLSTSRVTGYTKWDRVLGRGAQSDPKLDDAVWPGHNCVLAIAVAEEAEKAVMASMETLGVELGDKGFTVFALPVSKVI
jgi:hypothetical protein